MPWPYRESFRGFGPGRSNASTVKHVAAESARPIRKEAKMSTSHQQALRVNIRWMVRRDLPQVQQIEREGFEFPWSEEDFVRCLRQRNCIGMVADAEDRTVGFMIYELQKTKLHVLNFAVGNAARRRGVGQQMIARLTGKLSQERRNRIVLEVRETNLAAQVFFRSQGFRAVTVLRDFYEDTTEDAYRMQYRYRTIESPILLPMNRIVRRAG
jgi:[ribosomal protein S18]-alanine N-acetyltransferase